VIENGERFVTIVTQNEKGEIIDEIKVSNVEGENF
jgi:hypothetical protein